MRDYVLYYSYKNIGDVLIIIFNNELENNRVVINDNVVSLYHDDVLLGYNIFNIKEVVKIKTNGQIFSPSLPLIEIINSILANHHLTTLEFNNNSQYFVGEVIDAIDLDEHKKYVIVDMQNDVISTIIKDKNINIHDLVVVSKSGTRLNNGELVKESVFEDTLLNGHICTNKELGLSFDDEIVVVDDKNMLGKDFFQMEETNYVGD